MEIFTLGRWVVRPGKQEDFVAAWSELGAFFGSLEHPPPPGSGTLVRSLDDHGLDARGRAAMGAELSAITTDDATILLLAWNPRRRGPLPRGASLGDVEAAFPGWQVFDEGPTGYPPPKPLRAEETWYRLHRS